VKNKIFIL